MYGFISDEYFIEDIGMPRDLRKKVRLDLPELLNFEIRFNLAIKWHSFLLWSFGLSHANGQGYKDNETLIREKHLAIFVNCFAA